jgi:hypothetical protein
MGAGKSVLLAELCRRVRAGGQVVVVAPTQALVRQLSTTVAEVCGSDQVGQYYADQKQPRRRIVVACYPSLGPLVGELAEAGGRCRLLVVDECHRSEASGILAAIPALQPAAIVGVTATPYRSVQAESLSLYSSIAYRYTWADGRRDGILVPPRYVWDAEADERGSLDRQCLDLLRAHQVGPAIVSARTIEDAERYAAWLTANSYPAAAIHSGLPPAEREARLEALRVGQYSALVHVSLLAEGVDLPWLGTICLRRPVGARVRLVQEIGRGSRAHPDKAECVVIDPHNLVGLYGLTHPEAIGPALEAEAEAEAQPRRQPQTEQEEPEILPPGPAIEVALQWSQRLLVGLAEVGAVAPQIGAGRWRTRRPSVAQLGALERLGRAYAHHLPESIRHAVLALSRRAVAEQLPRGTCSDLITILFAVAAAAPRPRPGVEPWRARRGWRYPWPAEVDCPPLQGSAVLGVEAIEAEARRARRRGAA